MPAVAFKFDDDQIEYSEGFKYQLRKTCVITIPALRMYAGLVSTRFITIGKGGRVVIKVGYAWDGASGPTIDTLSSMRCSLVHDVLYQLMRMGMIHENFRGMADELLCEIGQKDKMWVWRVHAWHKILEWAGKSSATKGNVKKIIKAPKLKEVRS